LILRRNEKHCDLKRPSGNILKTEADDLLSQFSLRIWCSGRRSALSASDMPQTSFTVSGIYRTGVDQLDRGIAFCPLNTIPIKPDTVSAGIFLKEGVDPKSIIAAYRNLFPKTAQFKSWADMMPDLKQLIDLNYVSMSIVIVSSLQSSPGISRLCHLHPEKHRNRIMKAMGVTSWETGFLIFSEVILMNLFASVIGVLAGILAALLVNHTGIDLTAWTSHNRYFAVSGIIFPRLTSYSLCLPPVVALLFSLAAAVWPAWLIARKKAAEVMRIV
jgi:ABC-type lipoprotein release transport system permease subunit